MPIFWKGAALVSISESGCVDDGVLVLLSNDRPRNHGQKAATFIWGPLRESQRNGGAAVSGPDVGRFVELDIGRERGQSCC
jgi:hypothetical protein